MEETIRSKRAQIAKQMLQLDERLSTDGILMTQQRQEIVEMKPMDLLASLKNGQLFAVEVVRAFQAKALELTRKLNCVTEFIPEAEDLAMECDLLPPEERGPLHGIPVSLKESINVRGMDTTVGLAKLLFNPVASNAIVVDALIQKGAIPFCKTNLSQLQCSFCSSNPVFGSVKNPIDSTRIPGGSSAGEAALIAGGGSILGIGSDLAGSIRVPATFCGCVGFKPTSSRISAKGIKKTLSGLRGTESSVGVLGKDAEIVTECLKVLCSDNEMSKKDPEIAPVIWNESVFTARRKLRFGYFDSIDIFPATPGVKRGVHIAKEALERAGHEVIPFEIENLFDMLLEALKIVSSDGGKALQEQAKGEKLEPFVAHFIKQSKKPYFVKALQGFLLRGRSEYISKLLTINKYSKAYDIWKCFHLRQKNIDNVCRSMKEKNIDLLLTPTYPFPAPKVDDTLPITGTLLYVMLCFNYLDFPSAAVPVTRENENDQKLLQDYPDDGLLLSIAKKTTEGALGLPIGVLVSGLPWQDDLVCRGMLELQEALKDHSL